MQVLFFPYLNTSFFDGFLFYIANIKRVWYNIPKGGDGMKFEICHVFAAGDFNGRVNVNKGDLVICADAGYRHAEKLGIHPDILLGDFDSIGELPHVADTIRHPVEKDSTDSHLAVVEGVKRGYDRFIVYGAIGGTRLEHTLANIQMIAGFAQNGIDVTLTDGTTECTAIHNSKICFDKTFKGYISVFCMSGHAEGVTIKGLKYSISDSTLSDSFPLGVSNEFIGTDSEISVKEGTLIIIYHTKDGK